MPGEGEGFGHFPLESFRFFNMKIIQKCLILPLLYAVVSRDLSLLSLHVSLLYLLERLACVILLTSHNCTLAARVTVLFTVEAQAGASADGQISE